jgi:hypothetical protein
MSYTRFVALRSQVARAAGCVLYAEWANRGAGALFRSEKEAIDEQIKLQAQSIPGIDTFLFTDDTHDTWSSDECGRIATCFSEVRSALEAMGSEFSSQLPTWIRKLQQASDNRWVARFL